MKEKAKKLAAGAAHVFAAVKPLHQRPHSTACLRAGGMAWMGAGCFCWSATEKPLAGTCEHWRALAVPRTYTALGPSTQCFLTLHRVHAPLRAVPVASGSEGPKRRQHHRAIAGCPPSRRPWPGPFESRNKRPLPPRGPELSRVSPAAAQRQACLTSATRDSWGSRRQAAGNDGIAARDTLSTASRTTGQDLATGGQKKARTHVTQRHLLIRHMSAGIPRSYDHDERSNSSAGLNDRPSGSGGAVEGP